MGGPLQLPPLPPSSVSSTSPPAGRAPPLSAADAVRLARFYLEIPADLGEPQRLHYGSRTCRTCWVLAWQYPTASGQQLYAAALDGSGGHVVQYYTSQAEANLSRAMVQLSRADALERAEKVLDRLAHRFRAELRRAGPEPLARPGPVTGDYTFTWDRVAWGIPVADEGATVVISGRTGQLISYRLNRSGNLPERPERALLSQDEATAHYRQMLWPQLWYKRYEPWPEPARWQVVYQRPPNSGSNPTVSAEREQLQSGRGTAVDEPPMPWLSLPPSPQPFRAPAAPIDREAALAVARSLTGRDDPPTIAEITRGSAPDPQQGFKFTWPVPSPSPQARFSTEVTVDAQTGLVHRYQDDAPMFGPQSPWLGDFERPAINFIIAYRPDLAPQLAFQRPPAPPPGGRRPGWQARFYGPAYPSWSMSFQYLRDGIPVEGVQARVEIHAVSGAILRFEFDDQRLRQPGEWPPAQNLISRETAFQRWLEAAPLTLEWDPAGWGRPFPRWRQRLEPGQHAIDARTGHLLDDRGYDLTALSRQPEDVASHPFRDEILDLVARGIFAAPNGRFRPDGTLTRAQAVRLLLFAAGVQRRGQYVRFTFPEAAELPEAVSYWVQAAIDAQMVTLPPGAPFRPDAPVTRADFALWTARALGYGAVTAAAAATTSPAPRWPSALATLAHLGALPPGGSDAAPPTEPLTRAEAAFMLNWVVLQTGRSATTSLVSDVKMIMDPSPGSNRLPAAPTIGREEAVRIARDLFAIPPEMGEPIVSTYNTDAWHLAGARVPMWAMNWRYKRDDPLTGKGYFALVRGDTGDVVSFSRNSGRDRFTEADPPGLPQLTRTQAQATAEAEVQRLARRYFDQMRPEPEPTLNPPPPLSRSQNFRWERMAHGIPVHAEGARVVIDAFSGDLVEFSLIWNQQPIDPPGPYLSAREATAGFRDAVRLEPVYRLLNASEGTKWRLVYQPLQYRYPAVDARSGALLDERGNRLDMADLNRLAPLPAPNPPHTPPPAPLDRAQALAVARALGGNAEPAEVREIRRASFPTPDPGFAFVWPGARVTVNARTGLIDQYAYRGPFPPFSETPALERAAAEQRAATFLSTHRPDLAPNLRLVAGPAAAVRETYGEGGPLPPHLVWRTVFQVLRDGIPVRDVQVEVDVLASNGAVTRFNIRDGALRNAERQGASWQPPPTALNSQWAMERLLAQAPLTLSWRRLEGTSQVPVLQWRSPASDFDGMVALTGQLIGSDGRDRFPAGQMPEDVADHPDRDAIATALVHGIMSSYNGRFRPEGSLSRAEAARLIVQMRNSRLSGQPARFSFPEAASLPSPVAAWVQAAYEAGHVTLTAGEPFRPDAPVTRSEFALWLTRAMGYGALLTANVSLDSTTPDAATPIPPGRSALDLLAELGVLGAGADLPESPLTRSEAARLLYVLGARTRGW